MTAYPIDPIDPDDFWATVDPAGFRSTDRPIAHEVDITPELALRWLANNPRNRRVSDRAVESYARDMVHGRWRYNGETIKLARDGSVLDGQQRLLAVVRAGVTVPMLVVDGLPREVQPTIDSGRRRSPSDELTMRGERNTHVLIATTRRALLHEQGLRLHNARNVAVSNLELLDYLAEHPRLRVSVEYTIATRREAPAPPSVIAFTHYLLSGIDPETAVAFFAGWVEACGLERGDPAFALRSRLLDDNGRRGHRRRDSVDEVEAVAYICYAWNAYRTGRRLERLNAPKGGWNSSNFPEPR